MFISENEAIQLTGYSRQTLYRYRIEGLIKWVAAKSGRKVRYHRTDLIKLIGLTLNQI